MTKTMPVRMLRRVSAISILAAIAFGTSATAQVGPTAPAGAAPQVAPTAAPAPTGNQLVVERIDVEGNQRVEAETVRSYMTIREGQMADARAIDDSLKTLFATGLFADVSIRESGAGLIVTVVENPIINRVAFEGNYRIDDEDLESETELKPRVVFTRSRVQSDLQRIIELYRRKGNFAAAIEPKIIQLPQNRVDLAYEISEGPETGVASIKFVGNKAYSDSDLRGEIATSESAWWKFLSTNDNYDPDRLTFDRELLRRFYLTNGYADFRVLSSVAEMAPDGSEFFVTFTVEEGELYTFGDIEVATELERLNPEELRALIEIEDGDEYDASRIDDAVDALTFAAGTEGYAFSDVRPRVRRDRENRKINITFRVDEGPRVYVERININGNTRTLDRVIRREMRLAEGDAFNRVLLSRSRDRIRALGLFANVEVSEEPGSQEDQTVISVDVEEQSTGELSIGAGFSSDAGIVGDIAIVERNLLGRGQFLRLRLSLSGDRQQIDLRFTEPYFMGRNLSAGIDLFGTESDFQDESGYDFQRTGAGVRFGFPMGEFSSLQLRTSYVREEIKNVSSRASLSVLAAEGVADSHLVGYTYSIDERDDPEIPTSGYTFFFDQTAGTPLGDNRFLATEAGTAFFHGFDEDFVLSLRLDGGYVLGYDGQDVRLNNRFFKGGSSFRGFEPSGVGPRDLTTDDALGGNAYAIGTAQISVPLFLPEELGIKGAFFTEFGSVGVSDEQDRLLVVNNVLTVSNIQDDFALRASGGFSIFWESPFGPVRVDLAEAFIKEDYDKTQFFRFSAGTSF
ncbi:outer membrane protein assembly factor BamA [Pyruvatibacter sp. HU-CL02332]|uniref:outer membrane protein assembly factor BamA n=1 Tax=Pyruvatibacter sp. HU-CL02332 TaxID=3127650 RepID=UPI003365ACAB